MIALPRPPRPTTPFQWAIASTTRSLWSSLGREPTAEEVALAGSWWAHHVRQTLVEMRSRGVDLAPPPPDAGSLAPRPLTLRQREVLDLAVSVVAAGGAASCRHLGGLMGVNASTIWGTRHRIETAGWTWPEPVRSKVSLRQGVPGSSATPDEATATIKSHQAARSTCGRQRVARDPDEWIGGRPAGRWLGKDGLGLIPVEKPEELAVAIEAYVRQYRRLLRRSA